MDKKGKFKLLSYLVDNNIIFYTSYNRNKKFIAFSILKISDISPILSILKEFLQKRYLNYFSIEISILDNIEKYILLCFIDYDKEKILHSFNSIYQKLSELRLPVTFLENKNLENKFLDIGFKIPDSKIHSSKSTHSIIIENKKIHNCLDIFTLNLLDLDKKNTFLYSFSNLIKKFNHQGFLIFNFKVKSLDQIISSCYFVELRQKFEEVINFENEINKFFGFNLISKFKLDLKESYKTLWRLEISNNHLNLEDINFLFITEEQNNPQGLSLFNLECENSLTKNKIDFHRLNKNLILIEQRILLIMFDTIGYNFMLRLFKNYYPKYTILIVVLDYYESSELKDISNLSKLQNIRAMNHEEFSNFDIKNLKYIPESNNISYINSDN